MTKSTQTTALLGDLIVAEYDEAATMHTDEREVSRRAIKAVLRLLRRARRIDGHEDSDGYRQGLHKQQDRPAETQRETAQLHEGEDSCPASLERHGA